MAGYGYASREAVRVKVKKCEGNLPAEWRKFSVDPQITSLEVLYSILAKAFDLKTDFSISYKALDPNGQEVYLAVLSDWDLDAAFLRAHNFAISAGTDPYLNLKVDIKPFSEASDWDASNTAKEVSPLQQSIGVGQKYVQNMQVRLPGLIMNQMEKTFSMVTRALNFVEDQTILQPVRASLSDTEFRTFLDSVGQIIQPHRLRSVIYSGGIDPSLRRVVWKHILNVYPDGMTGRERMDYMKRKSSEYYRLRDTWRAAVQRGPVVGELAYVTSMVRKDVLRTDRLHPFYAGNDDNQNIAALFNILTTYALNHPAVSYCQGMSDIASPLLVTMCDEAQAYICFCAVMKRLNANFMLDGIAMTLKFTHLSEALQFYDAEFFDYLKMHQADDLLFCYRWLLLEMKREFAFEDSLRMLEVLWSSLPPEPPAGELQLFEKEFIALPVDLQPPPKSPSGVVVVMRAPRENAYTKLCALRRQSSSQSLIPTSPNALNVCDETATKSLDATKRLNQSLDENINRRNANLASTHTESKTFQSLDESKIQWSQERCEKAAIARLEVKRNEKNNHQISETPSPTGHDDAENDSTGSGSPSKSCVHTNHVHRQIATGKVQRRPFNSGGHFKDLKERLAAGKKGTFTSIDKSETGATKDDADDGQSPTSSKSEKIVKNFNEFLNFASNKGNRISLAKSISLNSDERTTTTTKLTKTSFEESDASSVTIDANSDTASNAQDAESVRQKGKLQLQLSDLKQLSLDGSSPEDSQEYFPMTTSITRELRLELDNLNRQVFGNNFDNAPFVAGSGGGDGDGDDEPQNGTHRENVDKCNWQSTGSNDSHISNNKSPAIPEVSYKVLNQNSTDVEDEQQHLDKIYRCPSDRYIQIGQIRVRSQNELQQDDELALKRASTVSDVFVWENPLHQLSPTPTAAAAASSIDNKNPFYAKDFVQTLTPDEQNDLEYDGEIIDESGAGGKKSITPIRLLRKHGDDVSGSSKRNPKNDQNASDSEDSSGENSLDENRKETMKNVNLFMKTSTISETNPFLMDIATSMTASMTLATTNIPLAPIHGDDDNNDDGDSNAVTPIDEEASEANIVLRKVGSTSLPSPTEFGGGNPFLMFLCLTLLLQHRNYVMKNNMDYNEMAMHFDKMVRKHNVNRVLNQARRMYAEYLKSQNHYHAVGGSGQRADSLRMTSGDGSVDESVVQLSTNVNNNNNGKSNFKNDIRA